MTLPVGKGPIFSVLPWSRTNSPDPSSCFSPMVREQPLPCRCPPEGSPVNEEKPPRVNPRSASDEIQENSGAHRRILPFFSLAWLDFSSKSPVLPITGCPVPGRMRVFQCIPRPRRQGSPVQSIFRTVPRPQTANGFGDPRSPGETRPAGRPGIRRFHSLGYYFDAAFHLVCPARLR